MRNFFQGVFGGTMVTLGLICAIPLLAALGFLSLALVVISIVRS
jgi:hypothetical protein